MNQLFYGDNLEILRNHVGDESVDLIYIDPPFNSNQAYNVIFDEANGTASQAQIHAFDDTWHWGTSTEQAYQELTETAPARLVETVESFRRFLTETNLMAYLVNMAIRLVELHRVLKSTGSFYLHCDPTASHYLKIVLDQIFGINNFRNEIIWHYGARLMSNQYKWNAKHDVILFYAKSKKTTLNKITMSWTRDEYVKVRKQAIHEDEDGREYLWEHAGRGKPKAYKRYLDKILESGKPLDDVWNITSLTSSDKERSGYPTQKPEALLDRIIQASSNEGDTVLDAFAGCGTAIAVAQRLNRQWIGIDITHLATLLIKLRLQDTFGDNVKYEIIGEPKDEAGARTLAQQNRYQFQWWALGLLPAREYQGKKKGADEGVDGVIYFQDVDPKTNKAITQKIIVQVKSGKVGLKDIKELRTTVENQNAVIGVFITLASPTPRMITEAVKAGSYQRFQAKYPKIQICTIGELLSGRRIEYPQTTTDITFKKAVKVTPKDEQLKLI